MTTKIIGSLFILPSANVIKVTRTFNEDLNDFGDELGEHEMVGAVYVQNPDSHMKTLQVRRDWFETYAKAS